MSVVFLAASAAGFIAQSSSRHLDFSDGTWLLAAGPVGAGVIYYLIFQYYRNTNKRHRYEFESKVLSKPIKGDANFVRRTTGRNSKYISGNNVTNYRSRVQRVQKKKQ